MIDRINRIDRSVDQSINFPMADGCPSPPFQIPGSATVCMYMNTLISFFVSYRECACRPTTRGESTPPQGKERPALAYSRVHSKLKAQNSRTFNDPNMYFSSTEIIDKSHILDAVIQCDTEVYCTRLTAHHSVMTDCRHQLVCDPC